MPLAEQFVERHFHRAQFENGEIRDRKFDTVAQHDGEAVATRDSALGKTRGEMRAMAEAGKLTTKTILDAFEAAGLEALRKGDDLYARGTEKTARMVGAIRAAKQAGAGYVEILPDGSIRISLSPQSPERNAPPRIERKPLVVL